MWRGPLLTPSAERPGSVKLWGFPPFPLILVDGVRGPAIVLSPCEALEEVSTI